MVLTAAKSSVPDRDVAKVFFMTQSFRHCFLSAVGDILPDGSKYLGDVGVKGDVISDPGWLLCHIRSRLHHTHHVNINSAHTRMHTPTQVLVSQMVIPTSKTGNGKLILTLNYSFHIKSLFQSIPLFFQYKSIVCVQLHLLLV